MLGTALLEDLNQLACVEAQDRYAGDHARAREALDSLLWIDTTQLERYARDGWIERDEVVLIERLVQFARDRLARIPGPSDPIEFTRSDPGWYAVRERALETLVALDGFVDLDIPGWGRQYRKGRN
jgi:hypothetical protein